MEIGIVGVGSDVLTRDFSSIVLDCCMVNSYDEVFGIDGGPKKIVPIHMPVQSLSIRISWRILILPSYGSLYDLAYLLGGGWHSKLDTPKQPKHDVDHEESEGETKTYSTHP
ncbi:hypothetical protein MUK42_36542 [Musa troglodytarum]|uniref:Uncharacterized protein n=1 Tax=Musa troglodytarum TaxID=320322 RepID=A0A9E7GHA6_9LILI|nr:hypothetical protein MUK42_36542 [Musa troglodytarum]